MDLNSNIYPNNNPHGLKDCGVVFTDRDHSYILDGEPLSGITGVISKHLFSNKYSGIPKSVLEAAKERGTRIHNELSRYDRFGECETDAQRSYKELGLNVIADEYLVTDFDNYATAIDKVAIINDEIWIGDVKTTYTLDEDYVGWQLSICKYLFELVNPDLEVKGMFAVHVKDDVATFVEIKGKDINEAQKLLKSDVSGQKYQNYEIATVENKEALALVAKITELTAIAKEIKEAEKQMRDQLSVEFEKLNVKKWETDSFLISKTADYTRTTFDSAKFKKLHPDMVSDFEKETKVKGGLKIKLK